MPLLHTWTHGSSIEVLLVLNSITNVIKVFKWAGKLTYSSYSISKVHWFLWSGFQLHHHMIIFSLRGVHQIIIVVVITNLIPNSNSTHMLLQHTHRGNKFWFKSTMILLSTFRMSSSSHCMQKNKPQLYIPCSSINFSAVIWMIIHSIFSLLN